MNATKSSRSTTRVNDELKTRVSETASAPIIKVGFEKYALLLFVRPNVTSYISV
jgi:hypothetical protein